MKQEFIVSVSKSVVGPTATKVLTFDPEDFFADSSLATEVRALAQEASSEQAGSPSWN